jgi:hypothetical protein
LPFCIRREFLHAQETAQQDVQESSKEEDAGSPERFIGFAKTFDGEREYRTYLMKL